MVYWELSVLDTKSSIVSLDFLRERLVPTACKRFGLGRELFATVSEVRRHVQSGPGPGRRRPWRPGPQTDARYREPADLTGTPRAKSFPVCSGHFYLFIWWNRWFCALSHPEGAVWTLSRSLKQWKLHETKVHWVLRCYMIISEFLLVISQMNDPFQQSNVTII